jgi:hypothetical protein
MRIPNDRALRTKYALVCLMIRPCSHLRLLIAIITLVGLLSPAVLRAQDFLKPAGYLLAQSEERQVWVNTATGIYHYSGTRWYGKTKQGKFMNDQKRTFGFRIRPSGKQNTNSGCKCRLYYEAPALCLHPWLGPASVEVAGPLL